MIIILTQYCGHLRIARVASIPVCFVVVIVIFCKRREPTVKSVPSPVHGSNEKKINKNC